MRKKNVVVSCVGRGALFNNWIGDNANYDIILINYEYDKIDYSKYSFLGSEREIRVINLKGAKFNLVHAIKDQIADYDYYLFPDADVLLNTDQVNEIFETAKINDLKIFAPAIEKLNYHYPVMYGYDNTELHYVNWLETQSMGCNNEYFHKIKDDFNINKSGYGLPNLWYQKFNFRNDVFAVIDKVKSIHTRPMVSNDGIRSMYDNTGGIDGAMNEYKKLLVDYRVKQYPARITGWQFTGPLLSVAIITTPKELPNLADTLKTIPPGTEVVILENEFNPKMAGQTVTVKQAPLFNHVKYYHNWGPYPRFDVLRNECLRHVSGLWVMALDSDEYLLEHQNENLIKELTEINNKPDIGGILVNVISNYKEFYENNPDFICIPSKICRLFRNPKRWNNCNFKYEGAGHETIEHSIHKAGFKIVGSTFKINHLGYEGDVKTMFGKAERNIKTMIKHSNELLLNEKKSYYWDIFIRDVLNYVKLKERAKNANTNS